MKDVHYNYLMAALKNIDLDAIESWENIPNGKLLAQPFGAYVNKIENHNILKALIFAIVVKITNIVNISVCASRVAPQPKGTQPFS